MAFLNERGHVFAGVGGGSVSVDNVSLGPGGAMGWLDADTVVYATQILPVPEGWDDVDGLAIVARDLATATTRALARRGCNTGIARAGVWAAEFSGDAQRGKPRYGMWTSTGLHWLEASPIAIGDNGAIAYSPTRTVGVRVHELDGADWELTPGVLYNLRLYGQGQALAESNLQLFVRGFEAPVTVGRLRAPHRIVVDGEPWIIYAAADQGRIVLHPWNSLDGYMVHDVARHGGGYGLDAVAHHGGIRVVFATTEGEQPGQVVIKDWTLREPRTDLRAVSVPDPAPDPDLPQEPEPVSLPNHFEVVAAVDRAHPHLIRTNDAPSVREFYWRAAWALHQHDQRWGMLSKSAGENGHEIPGAGRVSVDAVAYFGEVPIVDILTSAGDGPGQGGITWGVSEHRRESNLWVEPPPFVEPGEPEPPQEPEPDPVDLAALVQMVKDLTVENAAIKAELATKASHAALKATQDAIAEALGALEARLDTMPRTFKADCGRSWGHAHEITITEQA